MNHDDHNHESHGHELDDHRHHPELLPPAARTDLAVMDDSDEDVPIPGPGGPYKARRRFSKRVAMETLEDEDPLVPRRRLMSRGDTGEGILRNSKRRPTMDDYNLLRFMSHDSQALRNRRALHSLVNLDADSHGLRTSQETEEDVCFPLIREHVRVNGIDFDELEEFIKEERETDERLQAIQNAYEQGNSEIVHMATGRHHSKAALKYTPKKLLRKYLSGATGQLLTSDESALNKSIHHYEEDLEKAKHTPPRIIDPELAQTLESSLMHQTEVKFGGTRITGSGDGGRTLPHRFSLFHSESEDTVHSPDIAGLVALGQLVEQAFHHGDATWWLDVTCPTDAEMKVIAKAFGIHPLTAEDIRMQELREKVELFRNYYFVCFHTFEQDKELAEYLEPINVYIVVFKEGVLSFHFSPVNHPALVRRRVRQLRDYVEVLADWICYALIDDITDAFVPVINGIEYEADAIEDLVFVVRDLDFAGMLMRIGELRRKVMTLMRLLSGKADVIKMFAKRCQDEIHLNQNYPAPGYVQPAPHFGTPGVSFGPVPAGMAQYPTPPIPGPGQTATPPIPSIPGPAQPIPGSNLAGENVAQPRADIALYLGDIQDHVVTMFQNLLAYEKIFSRSHGNYLAQLQVESFYANNRITEMFSKVTLIGTIMVPLNLVTGLFGMNVTVPGQDTGSLEWWFGILGVMIGIILILMVLANWWLSFGTEEEEKPVSSRRSLKSFKLKAKDAKSVLSFPNKWD